MLFQRFALSTKRSFLFVILILLTEMVSAADWPHWRGPNRNDITPETSGFKGKEWITKRLWNKRVGYGSTSPIVYKNRLYTAGWANNKDYIYCLNAATGKKIWKKSYNCRPYGRFARGDQGAYKGTTSTPEYDPKTNLLYTLSTDGHLRCWNADNGRGVWHFNLYDKYKVPRRPGNRDYGYTSSPLALDKWLIVEVGDNEGCLMAFNKRTGNRIWTSKAKDAAGHNSGPTPITIQNTACIATFTCAGLLVTRTDKGHEGQTVATYPWKTTYNQNIASAAVSGNRVLITSNYNQNKICLFDITLKGIAKKRQVKSDFSRVGTPVIYKNNIYIPYRRLRLYRINKDSLKLTWKASSSKLDFGSEGSCLITGDKKIIAFGSRGNRYKLVLIDISGTKPKLLGANENVFAGIKRSSQRAWPHVILANRRIYCKDREGNIVCLSLK
jgi:outer membrane protein assembly factor BamB